MQYKEYTSLPQIWLYSLLPLKYYESKGIKDLGFTRVHGESRYNDAKNAEILDRVSM